jgi:hypothetical protein
MKRPRPAEGSPPLARLSRAHQERILGVTAALLKIR